MFNVRWTSAFALVAFAVSLLAGLIGGLPFGRILLRALIGSAVFAALGAAAAWLVQRFIPELLQVGGEGRAEAGAREQGEAEIDITLPEENPHFEAQTAGEDETGFEEMRAGREARAKEPAGLGDEAAGTDETGEPDEDREEEERITSEIPDVDLSDDLGGVDVLSGTESPEGGGQGLSSVDGGGDSGIEIMGENQDPATAAKAIQTWLKKDKEG